MGHDFIRMLLFPEPKSRCWQDQTPSRAFRQESMPIFSLLVAAGIPWLVAVSFQSLPPPPLCVSAISHCLVLMRHLWWHVWPTWIIFNFIMSANILPYKNIHRFLVQGPNIFGATVEPTTNFNYIVLNERRQTLNVTYDLVHLYSIPV